MRQFIFIIVGVIAGLLSSAEAYSLTASQKADGYGSTLEISVSHKRHHYYSHRRHHRPRRCCATTVNPCCLYCPCCPSGCYSWNTDASPLDNILALGIGGSFMDGGLY